MEYVDAAAKVAETYGKRPVKHGGSFSVDNDIIVVTGEDGTAVVVNDYQSICRLERECARVAMMIRTKRREAKQNTKKRRKQPFKG